MEEGTSETSADHYGHVPFIDRYHHYYQLNIPVSVLKMKSVQAGCSNAEDRKSSFIRVLRGHVEQAMKGRYVDYGVEELPSTASDYFTLLLAFTVSPDWNSFITIGPAANSPLAASFREFWHGEVHVRKFADHRMCVAVEWAKDAVVDAVPLRIIRFVMNKKWGVEEEMITWRTATPTRVISSVSVSVGQTVSKAFNRLSHSLRTLTGLSLPVTTVHAASAFLRGTEPFDECVVSATRGGALKGKFLVPLTNLHPAYKPSLPVHIRVEQSGKWGDDEASIHALSTAFYCDIAQRITEQFSLFAVPTQKEVFIMVDQVVFRVELVHGKLHGVLKKKVEAVREQTANRTAINNAQKRVDEYERKFIREQELASSLQVIAVSNPSYSLTVRMFKMWLGANMMSCALSDYTIEQIVATVYLDNTNHPTPRCAVSAFRHVLALIATHDWAILPLILDFNNEWTDRMSKCSSFLKLRPFLPPMVVMCKEDEQGSTWTRHAPDAVLLKRLVALSRGMHELLTRHITAPNTLDLNYLVGTTVTSSADDVLETNFVTRVIKKAGREWKNTLPVVDWDTIEALIHTLQLNFGHLAYFLYNRYSPKQIGIKWKETQDGCPITLTRCGGGKRKAEGGMMVNRDEVMEGIAIIAGTLIHKVQLQEEVVIL